MLDFTTQGLPESGRAARYSEVLGAYYSSIEPDRQVVADISEQDALNAFSMAFDLGRLSCSVHKCNSPLHRYSMRQSPMRLGYSLQYIVEGNLTIVSDDYCHVVAPGDMVFLRSQKVQEYHTSSGGSKTIGVHVPWALVQALAYGRSMSLDQVFTSKSGIGACVASLIGAIFNSHVDLSASDRAALQVGLGEAVVQLGTLTTSSIADPVRAGLFSDIKAIATAALDDPDLSPAQVAAKAGVSVRTLHRIFQASGETFWNWIRDRRLERCHAELTAPTHSKRTITEVAFRWGFNELSTFDRNFRKRYGASPRQVRSLAHRAL
jgi:AraC-like DNA-binding protein